MSGLIISGMHHSGTSVIAGLVAAAGWYPGDDLIPKDERLNKQFWEDREFVEINRGFLALPAHNSKLPNDWGLYNSVPKEVFPSSESVELVKGYCDRRRSGNSNWLAKDPRSTLTIPVWAEVEDTKFLFVYRNPWDVMESLMRFGAPFSGQSDLVLAAWKTYNVRLLEMFEKFRSRCALISSAAALNNPENFAEMLSDWSGQQIKQLKPINVIDPKLFKDRPEGTNISKVFRTLNPDESEVLEALDSVALLPRNKVKRGENSTFTGNDSGTTKSVQVVITCKNDGQYLGESIASVLDAADAVPYPIELTIVDSISDEKATLEYLERLRKAGFQVIQAAMPGLPAARNLGVKMSKSEVIVPLDADNRIRPNAFLNARFIFEKKADFIYGNWERFGLETQTVIPPVDIKWNVMVPHNTLDSCTLMRRSTLAKLNGWDRSLTLGLEDWDLWLRALQGNYQFQYVDEIFFDYFVRPKSMTWNLAQNPTINKDANLQIIKKHIFAANKAGIDVNTWENLIQKESKFYFWRYRFLKRFIYSFD